MNARSNAMTCDLHATWKIVDRAVTYGQVHLNLPSRAASPFGALGC
ncbi:hypothetical protein ACOTFF_24900 [Achromobacter xylosoxidans]